MFKIIALIAPIALSTAAMAQPSHLSDAQYIAAARCQALMSSSNLGKQDTHSIDAMLKAESASRSNAVYDRADSAREDAEREARHAGTYSRPQLVAERDGVCQSVLGSQVQSASVSGPSRIGVN